LIQYFFEFFTPVTLPFAWYHYFDNKPKLIISDEGILFEDKGFYYWGMIINTNIKEINKNG